MNAKRERMATILFRALVCFSLLPALVLAAGADGFFDSRGVRLHYFESGSGPPILLIHGFTQSADRWAQTGVVARLSRRYRVIALDIRGHGQSDKPHDSSQYVDLDGDVARLLDRLKIKRAHIVGYSMGGSIMAQLLVTHPERFLTATLVGSTGVSTPDPGGYRELMAEEFEHNSARLLAMAIWPTNEPPPTEEQIGDVTARVFKGNDSQALAALLRAPTRPVTEREFVATKVPVLAVAGTADPAFRTLTTLSAKMPQMTLVGIEGVGHGPSAERPEVVQAIELFIEAHGK
jgi:pimeloyl-ACP methyl ester carboxylesterase